MCTALEVRGYDDTMIDVVVAFWPKILGELSGTKQGYLG